jgi:3-oxoacyl-[acyl-carrier protein] reductase
VLTLRDRSALITGGGRGIGRATTLLFGRLGCRVAITYVRHRAEAQRTVDDLSALGVSGLAVKADLSRPGAAAAAVAQTVAAFGQLDILVVNHGIWKRAPFETLTREQWDETLAVNLDGAYAVCQQAAREMLARGKGSIVLVSSTAGQRGEAHHSHYAASKGALIALTQSLASELGPRGVRINAVAPGWVVTDMTRESLGSAPVAEPIPTGGPASPEQVAGPIAFLASDLASFVHGEVLSVNGGAVMA